MKGRSLPGPRGLPAAALRIVASAGRPLEPATRSSMEARFGHDFSRVRVHDDSEAADSARDLAARAYSVGSHLVFGWQRYAPGTPGGDALLAHELAHAVQHDRHGPASGGRLLSDSTAPAEREAARAAAQVARGEAAPPLAAAPSAALHRDEDDPFAGMTAQYEVDTGEREYGLAELRAYLRAIRKSGQIEGREDSDDKAVRIVGLWRRKSDLFPELDGRDKAIMIWELLDGPTTEADEDAIVQLLERSDNEDLYKIFWIQGDETQQQIAEDVPDGEGSQLADFCRRRWEGGIKAFRKGSGRPREDGRPIPLGVSLPGPIPIPEDPEKPPRDRGEETRSKGPHEILSFQGGESKLTPALEDNMRALAERHGATPGLSFKGVVDFLMSNRDVRDFVPDAVLELQRNGLIPPGSIEMGTKMGLEEGLKAGLKALAEIAARQPATEAQPFPTGPAVTIGEPLKPTTVLPPLPIPIDPAPASSRASLPSIRIHKAALQTAFKPGAAILFDFTVPDYFRGRAAVEVVDESGAPAGPAVAVEGLGGARQVQAPKRAGRYRLRIRPADDPDSTSIGESLHFGVKP